MSDAPRASTATFHILTAGYYQRGVASTVGLIRDGAVTVVVDPGIVSDRSLILDPPGHSAEDITTLAHTSDGVAAFTHVWWNGEGPAEDPYAEMEQLHASRARVLAIADVAIPGNGPAFKPSTSTPR
jgi:hypothetical protein